MHLNRTRICQDLSEIDFPSDVSKQAISKARKGISPSLFHELFRLTVRSYYQMVDSRKTWNGYHLFAVDGSKLQLPDSKDILKITRSASDDSIQFIKDPASGLDVPVRVIRVVLDSGTVEYLVTNVFDPSITPEMFKQLYFFRWKIESKYNEFKNQWGLEEFSGSSSLSVMQDLFINMMYSYLSSIVKKDADIRIANSSRPDNKFAYQANRAFIIGEIKYLLPRMLCGSFRKWMVTDLFLSAAKVKSQIQPGRKYKRCKKKDNLWTHHNHRKTVL